MNKRDRILTSSSYWIEAINGMLYNNIVEFMESKKMRQKDLARHLDISEGRVSQILNDGDINFSIEKVVDIALKIDKIPSFDFIDKEAYLNKESQNQIVAQISHDVSSGQFYSPIEKREGKEAKVISLYSKNEKDMQIAIDV